MIVKGVNLIPDVPMSKVVELGQEAEKLGYDKCWVYDEGLATRDVYVSLTAIGQKTEKIQLGTGITSPFTRHPAATASAIATLDELSGGRAFLGLGAGGTLTLAPMVIERQKPLTAVREMLQAIRPLLRGETVTFDGEIVKLKDASINYPRPNLPVWIAGRGSKMLKLGGELADGVVLDFIHKDFLPKSVELIKSGAQGTGNAPKICYSTMVITHERVMQELRPHMTYRLVDSPQEVKDVIGMTPDDVAAVASTMGAKGLVEAGKLIKDEWIAPFVIMGTEAECARELSDLMSRNQFDEFLLPILETNTAVELMAEVGKVLSMV
ncbi:MAG: LLM class flavin-dependent oxidoreductase [Anaerolineaceae bacterium]|nr:LLM class flavin-dependent oxidoreductase [Anaerolineaceae bacterium]